MKRGLPLRPDFGLILGVLCGETQNSPNPFFPCVPKRQPPDIPSGNPAVIPSEVEGSPPSHHSMRSLDYGPKRDSARDDKK